jgi:hypothetical protein
MVGFFFSCLGGIAALKRKLLSLSLTSAILAFAAEFAYLVALGSLREPWSHPHRRADRRCGDDFQSTRISVCSI